MPSGVTVDDLRLARALIRHGSLGAAAKELIVSQPSASHRLSTLERKLRLRLFDRSTTGTIPTSAGRELGEQAVALLAQLDDLPARLRAADSLTPISLGCIASLASIVFTCTDSLCGSRVVRPTIDHGPGLLRALDDRSLDAAVVAIVEQASLPRDLQTMEIIRMEMVLVLPGGVPGPESGKHPFRGREVVFSSPDRGRDKTHSILASLGATPHPMPTAEAAIRVARAHSCAAIVPDILAHWYAEESEAVVSAPFAQTTALTLVTRPGVDDWLSQLTAELRSEFETIVQAGGHSSTR